MPPAREPDLTQALVDRLHRCVQRPPERADLTPLTDADFDALCARLCAQVPPEGLHVFAYGSLIWKPAFDHVAASVATLNGWRRAFCIHMQDWRATPDNPGLMLGLARGGSCRGVAYRLPDDDRPARIMRLLRREVSYHQDLPWLRWANLRLAGGGTCRALVFYCAVRGDPDYVQLPLDAQAERLARAVGHVGSGAEYLRNTVLGLQSAGIHDGYLWRLQAQVAARIRADHGLTA
jgi:cation transport protein ChaC